jgi:hypothetical protein
MSYEFDDKCKVRKDLKRNGLAAFLNAGARDVFLCYLMTTEQQILLMSYKLRMLKSMLHRINLEADGRGILQATLPPLSRSD